MATKFSRSNELKKDQKNFDVFSSNLEYSSFFQNFYFYVIYSTQIVDKLDQFISQLPNVDDFI